MPREVNTIILVNHDNSFTMNTFRNSTQLVKITFGDLVSSEKCCKSAKSS